MENLKVKLSALKENEDNPREITKEEFDSLKKSILTFPKMLEIRPIAAAVKDGGIIYGGNMRFRALNEINKLSLIKIGEIIGSSRKAAKIGESGVRSPEVTRFLGGVEKVSGRSGRGYNRSFRGGDPRVYYQR